MTKRSFFYHVLLLCGLISISALSSPQRIVTAFTSGFKSSRSNVILEALLANPTKESTSEDEGVSIYTYSSNITTGKVDSAFQLATFREPPTLTAILPKSDLSIIYIDQADLYNENAVLARMQSCFRSLLSPFNVTQHESTGSARRPFIVVLSGPATAAPSVERLLKDAWLLLDTEGLRNNNNAFSAMDASNLFALFDVQIMLIPRSVPINSNYTKVMASLNPQAVQAVLRSVSSVAVSPNRTMSEVLHSTRTALGSSLSSLSDSNPNPNRSANPNYNPSTQHNTRKIRFRLPFTTTPANNDVSADPRTDSEGIELASAAVNVAFTAALKRANTSAPELSTLHTEPHGFAKVLSQMVANATQELRDYVHTYGVNSNGTTSNDATNTNTTNVTKGSRSTVSAASLRWAEKDLSNKLYTRLLPFYKRQVALLKADAGAMFNKQVAAENMPVTIHILEDLLEAQDNTLRNFSTRAALLAPREAPASLYNAFFETLELQQVIEEFVTDREHQYRAVGVLPRGGNIGFTIDLAGTKVTFPPTEISFHLLAMHPLGRDYRQDVLGMRNTDKFSIAEGSAESNKGQLGRKVFSFAKNAVSKLVNSQLTDKVIGEAYIPKEESAEVLRARLREKIRVLEAELQAQQLQARGQKGLLQSMSLRRLGRTLQLRRQLSQAKKQGEFAREMMMLPLSLKNPDLGGSMPEPSPDSLPRRADKQLKAGEAEHIAGQHLREKYEDYGKSAADSILRTRQHRGPEKYIRWDLEPLDEAKEQLEQAKIDTMAAAAKEKSRKWRRTDEILMDYLPFKDKTYQHPAVNYGPAYRAQQEPVVLEKYEKD